MRDAVIYARVSTQDQAETGSSLDSQVRLCSEWAARNGYRVALVVREDWPGGTLERPELERVRQMVRRREVEAVIFHALDRLSRDPVHAAILLDEALRAKVELECVTEALDTSREGQLVAYIRGYAAAMEREKIRERSMRGKREKALQGEYSTAGRAPFGYTYAAKSRGGDGRFRICEDEVPLVRRIFHELVEERRTLTEIAARLNADGLTTRGGKRWRQPLLSLIVHNPIYCGRLEMFRWTYVEPARPPRDRKFRRSPKTTKRATDPGTRIVTNDVVPGIVSEDTWRRAQQQLEANRARAARNSKHDYLLRSLIFCAHCGWRCVGDFKTRRYYRCPKHSAKSADGLSCSNRWVNADHLEAWVWREISAALTNPAAILDEIQVIRNERHDPGLADSLRRRIEGTRQREARTLRYAALGEFDLEIVRQELAAIRKERDRLVADLARVEQTQPPLQLDASRVEQLAALVLQDLTAAERRGVLEDLDVRIELGREQVRLTGVLPEGLIANSLSRRVDRNSTREELRELVLRGELVITGVGAPM
jgi:site-specific DNA recombinase